MTNRETGETRSVSASSETGAYTVGPLRIGRYDVAVEEERLQATVQPDVELHAQDTGARVDLKLDWARSSRA